MNFKHINELKKTKTMTENKIETIAEFENVISEIKFGRLPFIGENYQELYRGQSKESYELKSGISRYASSPDNIGQLEKEIIKDFQDLINESTNPNKFIQLSKQEDFENDWRWLEQMQHYRLPTRLLDWTLEAKIALFFAVERNFEDDGQFWIFKSPLNWSCDDHFDINPYSEELDIISNSSFYVEDDYLDKIAEQRRGFQSGKFTVQDCSKSMIALENQNYIEDKFIKYVIPANSKKTFLDYLAKCNITEETVYVKYDDEIENLVSKIKTKYNFK